MTAHIVMFALGVCVGIVGTLYWLHKHPSEAVKLADELISKIGRK